MRRNHLVADLASERPLSVDFVEMMTFGIVVGETRVTNFTFDVQRLVWYGSGIIDRRERAILVVLESMTIFHGIMTNYLFAHVTHEGAIVVYVFDVVF